MQVGERRTIWVVDEYGDFPEPEAHEAIFEQHIGPTQTTTYWWHKTGGGSYLADATGAPKVSYVFLTEEEAIQNCITTLLSTYQAAQDLLIQLYNRIIALHKKELAHESAREEER